MGPTLPVTTASAPSRATVSADWMPAPCRGCAHAERDWGGCRCQAFALTGDAAATDPACALSPHHGLLAEAIAGAGATTFRYREFG